MKSKAIEKWHEAVAAGNPGMLDTLLADDAVFHSPVVHTPQAGKRITQIYLTAAFDVLFNDSFKYTREIIDEKHAALEFEAEIDGIYLNGVDLITWNAQDQITDFKVLIRPLKAIGILKDQMAAKLESMK